VTAGFAIMAVAMAPGAPPPVGSSTGYAAAWVPGAGVGLGPAMAAPMNVALGALSGERRGSGAALLSPRRPVGGTIGVAVLGTLISNSYSSRVDVSGLPSSVAELARSSVAGGAAVARKIGSPSLLDSVRTAFIHGMDIMLWTCGGIALVSAVLALLFLPRRPGAAAAAGEPVDSASISVS